MFRPLFLYSVILSANAAASKGKLYLAHLAAFVQFLPAAHNLLLLVSFGVAVSLINLREHQQEQPVRLAFEAT